MFPINANCKQSPVDVCKQANIIDSLTVRRSLFPRIVDVEYWLLFWKLLTVHRLVDHVQTSSQNDGGQLRKPIRRQSQFINVKHISSNYHCRTIP